MNGTATSVVAMFLAPWHDELRRFYDPSWDGNDTENDTVWLLAKHEELVRPYDRAVEALCLLSQLARVDVEAFRRELLAIWDAPRLQLWLDSDRYNDGASAMHKRPALRFGIQVCEFLENTLLPSTQQLPPSAEFTELWGRLAARPSDRQCIDTEVPMVVPMCIDVEGDGCCTKQLEWFLTLVKAQQQAAPPPVGTPCLRIDALYLLSGICLSLDERGFEIVMEVTASGIKLRELPGIIVYDTSKTALQVVEGLRTLLRLPLVGGPASGSSTVTGGYICRDSKHLVPAYMTAVQESLSMRSLRVNLDIDPDNLLREEREKLRWNFQLLAYTLFSEHANHQLQLLELDVQHFDENALSAIVETLEDHDPLGLLFTVEDDTRDAFPKQIAACQFYLYAQGLSDLLRAYARISRAQEQVMYESLDPIIVRVIEGPAEDEWWRVLLPGWGCAWVHEDDMMPVDAEDYLPVRASVPSIPSITVMTMSNESMTPVADLLATIATGTQHLTVVDRSIQAEPALLDGWCSQVLASCRCLKSLKLSVASVANLTLFVNAAVEYGSTLESLELDQVLTGEADDVTPFCEALCDPNHPLTKHLRVLDLRFVIEGSQAPLVIEPLQRMLRVNRSLLSVDVWFHDPYTADKVDPEMVSAAFADAASELFVIRVGPLAMEKKLAFLSAVQDPSSHASLQRLDTHVLANIFRFAARGRSRHVEAKVASFSRPRFDFESDESDYEGSEDLEDDYDDSEEEGSDEGSDGDIVEV